MSIAVSLSNAKAGLSANSTLLSAGAQNVANAQVDGYVRRDGMTTNASGTARADITRGVIDPYIQRDLRWANSETAAANMRTDALNDIAQSVGAIDGSYTPSEALTGLETALVALEANPSSSTAQQSAVNAAKSLVDTFASASTAIADARARAHAGLEADINSANQLIADIDGLNSQIVAADGLGRDASALRDQRDAAVNALSELLPVSTNERANGEMVIAIRGGPTLLDGYARSLEFDAAVVPAGAGAGYPTYPGIAIDDPNAPAAATDLSRLTEGRIGGAVQARDVDLVQAERQLDALARGTILAFQNADASVVAAGAGTPGLFTDAGTAIDPLIASDLGLAGRMAINPAIDPDQGGTTRLMRDGLASPAPGASKDATQIRDFIGAFSATTTFPADANLSIATTLSGFAAEASDALVVARSEAANRAEVKSAVAATLQTERDAAAGVDLDAEAQRLLEVERFYAANAQVVTVASRLLDQLLAAVR